MQETSHGKLASAMFRDVPYVPTLLFDAHFDASITDDAEFRDACEIRFRSYFDGMWDVGPNDEYVFVDRFYTIAQVRKDIKDGFQDVPKLVSLPFCAGFWLGWVSALALVQPKEAQAGLYCLLTTVERVQAAFSSRSALLAYSSEYTVSPHVLLSRTGGADGWPLDM